MSGWQTFASSFRSSHPTSAGFLTAVNRSSRLLKADERLLIPLQELQNGRLAISKFQIIASDTYLKGFSDPFGRGR